MSARRQSLFQLTGAAALAMALTLPGGAQSTDAIEGDAPPVVETTRSARQRAAAAKKQPSLRGISPIETELLTREGATFKSTRNIFAFVEPPPPPPPPPPLPPPDKDKDGVPDFRDNCPTVFNPDQSDIDQDGIGTACETELPEIAPPPPPPPKPRPPAFNYSVLGTFGRPDHLLAVFSKDGEIVNVAVGDSFGPRKEFILRRIGIESVEIGFANFPPGEFTRVRVGK
ncbi:MAG: thrombospondin type 3 repeat-containing protein [Thermoanaerobaculia bacterium]